MTSPKGMAHKAVFEKLGESEVRLQFLNRSDDVGLEAREWIRLLEQERQEKYLRALHNSQVNATRFGAIVGGACTVVGAVLGAVLTWALQFPSAEQVVRCEFPASSQAALVASPATHPPDASRNASIPASSP